MSALRTGRRCASRLARVHASAIKRSSTPLPGSSALSANVGDRSSIDDFVFLNAGVGTEIGRYVHVACHVSVIGGGGLTIGDYAVLASGARILTATDSPVDPLQRSPGGERHRRLGGLQGR